MRHNALPEVRFDGHNSSNAENGPAVIQQNDGNGPAPVQSNYESGPAANQQNDGNGPAPVQSIDESEPAAIKQNDGNGPTPVQSNDESGNQQNDGNGPAVSGQKQKTNKEDYRALFGTNQRDLRSRKNN